MKPPVSRVLEACAIAGANKVIHEALEKAKSFGGRSAALEKRIATLEQQVAALGQAAKARPTRAERKTA